MQHMTTKILFIKHIHSCFASASSNDVWVGIEIDSNEFPHNLSEPIKPNSHHDLFSLLREQQRGNVLDLDERIEVEGSIIHFPNHFLDGEKVLEIIKDDEYPHYMKVYVEADRTFYEKALREKRYMDTYDNSDEFKELVQSYVNKGWIAERKFYETEDTEKFELFRKNKKLYARAEKELVLWNYGESDFNVAQYQGGFSDEFYKGRVQEYCESGCVFGWMGDTGTRTHSLDKFLEKAFVERGLPLEPLRCWVTSKDARHFSDDLHGLNQTEQEQGIKMHINRIYNLGLIYDDPRHKGTLKSTNEVKSFLESEGKLLTEIQNL